MFNNNELIYSEKQDDQEDETLETTNFLLQCLTMTVWKNAV